MKNTLLVGDAEQKSVPGFYAFQQDDACNCPCHDTEHKQDIVHAMACCHPCPHCGQRIKIRVLVAHVGACLKAKKENEFKFSEMDLRILADHPEAFDDISKVDRVG